MPEPRRPHAPSARDDAQAQAHAPRVMAASRDAQPGRPGAAWPACRWQVRLLGALELHDGARTLTRLPSRAAAALVARLAIWPDREHPREELVDLLWPGAELDVGRNRLRQTLSVLRGLLEAEGAGPVIVADRRQVRAAPGAFASDVSSFEAALRAGDREAARAWYRGDLLPGFYDEWIDDERLRLQALADRLDLDVAPAADAARDTPSQAARTAAGKTTRTPARPAAVVRSSSPVAAPLPHYLTPVFGIDLAGARLREAILAHRLVTVAGPGGGGKTRLVVEVARTLADDDGVGGWRRWPGELAFITMGECRTRAELLDRLVMTLRLDPAAGEPIALVRQALAGREMLLVLDNLEQAAGPAAALVATLLSESATLRIVTTSRQVLGVDGEHLVPVEPLPAPDARAPIDAMLLNPAVALFVDRARERRADFHLGAHNGPAIAELVRLLEGHPLAIELAAARVRSTPPAQWVALLREGRAQAPFDDAGETLSLLARPGPRAGGDGRHASMTRVIAGSWDLLAAPARRLLGAIATFDGGCDAAAARAVAAPETSVAHVQATLDELVSSSLVVAQDAPARAGTGVGAPDDDAGPRFVPYESVREYAAAQFPAADRAAWRARHRQWMRELARAPGPTPDLARLRDEMPNLLLALASARRDGQPAQAWRLVHAHRAALADITLPATGLDTLEAALRDLGPEGDGAASPASDGPTDLQRLRLFADAVLAWQAYESGRHAAAVAHADAVLARLSEPGRLAAWRDAPAAFADDLPLADDEPLGGWAAAWALRIRMRVGRRIDEHDPWLIASLDEARATASGPLEARLLSVQASLMMRNRSDHAGAEVLRRRVLALSEASGDRLRTNEARVALAICLGFQHRIEEQLPLLAATEREARALDQPRLLCFSLSVRGYCLADLRRFDESRDAFRACLHEASRALAWRELFYGLWNLPRTLAHLRAPRAAAQLMGFAESFYAARFGALGPEDLREARRTRRLAAVQLGAEATAQAWREGQGLGVTEALALAFATGGVGHGDGHGDGDDGNRDRQREGEGDGPHEEGTRIRSGISPRDGHRQASASGGARRS